MMRTKAADARKAAAIQESQYERPYHHFVSLDGEDPRFFESLGWGLEYYSYVSHVLEFVGKQGFKNLAEVGCGDGKILLELAKRHPEGSFEGYDLSSKAIRFAQAYADGQGNISFSDSDFSTAKKKYDLILLIEVLEHIPDQQVDGFLRMIAGSLSAGGKVIMTVPTTNTPLHPKHYRHYDERLLRSQTRGMFRIERLQHLYDSRSWGSATIRFLLGNRFFLLNWRPMRKMLFRMHRRRYGVTTEKKGKHLFAVLGRDRS